jgi:hypothetical protein
MAAAFPSYPITLCKALEGFQASLRFEMAGEVGRGLKLPDGCFKARGDPLTAAGATEARVSPPVANLRPLPPTATPTAGGVLARWRRVRCATSGIKRGCCNGVRLVGT